MAIKQGTPRPARSKKFLVPLLIAGGIVLLGIFAALTIVILTTTQGGDGMTKEQITMEQYLEKKYGQEFVVEKPIYKNSSFGVDGIWVTTAHPKNDPSIVFDLDGTKDLSRMYDQYIASLWSKEQTEKIQPTVNSIYSDTPNTKVSVKIIFSGKLLEEAVLGSTTYDEARTEYADSGFYYEYRVTTPLQVDPSAEADRIYRLIELAKNSGIAKIGVFYVEDRSGDKLVCRIGPSKIVAANDTSIIEDCLNNKLRVGDERV